MEGLLSLLHNECLDDLLEKLQQTEGNLSKRFSNRLMHLAFYLVLNKVSALSRKRILEREIRQYIFCEYYSRKFNFK